MNRLAILTNAASRRNRDGATHLRMLDGMSDVTHRVTREAAELPAALEELLASEPAALAVNGGDGTLHAALTEMLRSDPARALPPLLALPGGTTNMSARDLGGGGALVPALRTFLALRDRPLTAWPVERRSVLLVRDASGARHAGLFFGIGTIVRGAEYWQRQLTRRAGEWGAGVALARGAWGIVRRQPPFADTTRICMRIDDGSPAEIDVLFLLTTVMRRLFLGLTPFWGPGEGALSCTWLDAAPRRLLRRLPAVLRGREAELAVADGYNGHRPGRLHLAFDDAWLLDGELMPASGPLELSASPPLAFLRVAP